jgi:fluoroquinolone transport system permease protein
MLSNVLKLFKEDVKRLAKYNILQISVVLAFVYAVIIYFTSAAEAAQIVPLLVFVDVTMMSIIMLGASLFFEKQEGSLKSVMVSPVSLLEVIIVKVMSAVLLSLITGAILSAVAILVHGASINIAILLLYATLGATAHIMIGFALVIISKDFNTLLVNYIFYVFIFTLPALFFAIGLIPESLNYLLYISPSYMTQMLINTSTGSVITIWEKILGIAYLISVTVVLFKTFVYRRFKEYIIRG